MKALARRAFRTEHARVVIPRGTVLEDDLHRAPDRVRVRHDPALLGLASDRAMSRFKYFTLFLMAATYLRRFGPSRTRLLRTQLGVFAGMTGLVVFAKGP